MENLHRATLGAPALPVDTSLANVHRTLTSAAAILDGIFADVEGCPQDPRAQSVGEADIGSPIVGSAQRAMNRLEVLTQRLGELRNLLASPKNLAQGATGLGIVGDLAGRGVDFERAAQRMRGDY